MPENAQLDENQGSPSPPHPAAITAGQVLKQARLKAGVHLAVISLALKVPVRQLEALEADQYLTDQSPVFVRGLASSVCRHLRIDAAPVLALLPQPDRYSEPLVPARQADVAPVEMGMMQPTSERFPKKAFWSALAMALLIAGLIWLPGPSQWTWMDEVSKLLKLTNLTQAVPAPEATTEGASKGATAADAPSLGAVTIVPFEPVPPVATPPSAVPSSPVAQTNKPSVAQPDPVKVPLAASKTGAPEWVFTATAESWLEVRDGQNQVLWSGILKPGESSRLQAPLPVSVVVGRADALQVRFKGQAFDLTPHSKMNVARFEVKP